MSSPDSPSTNTTSAHRALYARYIALCNAHDFTGMESFYTPHILINDSPVTPPQVTEQFKELVAAFPDWHWEIRHFGVEGDFLYLHFRVTGTHEGEWRGVKATGRKVVAQQFTLYRVEEGGKYGSVWDMTDLEAVRRQIS